MLRKDGNYDGYVMGTGNYVSGDNGRSKENVSEMPKAVKGKG
jgi:hypothetical protein